VVVEVPMERETSTAAVEVGDVMRFSLALLLGSPLGRIQLDVDGHSVFVVVDRIVRESDGTKTMWMRAATDEERPPDSVPVATW